MTAIVMNTMNAAVSEHDIDFQSLTPTHFGSANGLYELGGDTDNELAIDARAMLPETDMGSDFKKGVGAIYFHMTGPAGSAAQLLVKTKVEEFAYEFPVREKGVSRGVPGKGIKEPYLALGFANLDGADFRIDQIEADVIGSQTRRI